MRGNEVFDIIEPEQIVDGQRVERVTNLVTKASISGVQVKDDRKKHIEVKLRVPYTEEDLGALGDMFGETADIALQAVRFYQPGEEDERRQGQLGLEGDNGY